MKIKTIKFSTTHIYIETDMGEKGNHPLAWFPRLKNATTDQLNRFTLSPFGIHWEELDEDLSFEGFFKLKTAAEQPRQW